MDAVALARAVHVIAVVVWIGGMAMATSVILPAVRRGDLGDPLKAFHSVERRFVWQARAAVILVGLTGFYMVAKMDLWDRFASASFWWMHAMACLWLLFFLILFVLEPFVLDRHYRQWARGNPRRALAWLHHVHWALLALSALTVVGAVAGSHGWTVF